MSAEIIRSHYEEQYAPTDYRSNPVAHYASADGRIKGRADWLPDQAVMDFVRDFLTEKLPLDKEFILNTNECWCPITILSTLEWIKIGGWWLFRYSDVGFSEEQYSNVWRFAEETSFTELDPQNLITFLRDQARNFFTHRWNNVGLSNQEHMDLIPFIEKIGFPQWGKEIPPREVTEIVSWATLLWVLSGNGFEWARDVDVVFDYTAEFDRSFLSAKEESDREELRLLDPRKMQNTNRPVGTCSSCGVSQYCVDGYFILGNMVMQKSHQAKPNYETAWVYLCDSCASREIGSGGIRDVGAENPKCGNHRCINTKCPNLKTVQDEWGNLIPESLIKNGQRRIDQYRQFIEEYGASPRQLSGQTLEDVLNHFRS